MFTAQAACSPHLVCLHLDRGHCGMLLHICGRHSGGIGQLACPQCQVSGIKQQAGGKVEPAAGVVCAGEQEEASEADDVEAEEHLR